MALNSAGLTHVLAQTALGGRPVMTLSAAAVAVRCGPEEVWEAWQAARSVVAETGRWPVVVRYTGNPQEDGVSHLLALTGEPDTVRRVVELADRVDPWIVFEPLPDDPYDAGLLAQLVALDPYLTDSDLADLTAAQANGLQLERRRLDRRIQATGGALAQVELSPSLTDRGKTWFTPHDDCAVLFLDTDLPWVAGVYTTYFGALEEPGKAALAAAEREWYETYGAELVSSWQTMRQYTVARPPTTVDQAWTLAGQLLSVGKSVQDPRCDLTLALMRNDFWFLHDRP